MKVKYDRDTDILRIRFTDTVVEESGEDKKGVILDYDVNGNIIGIEVLKASARVNNPQLIEYEEV